MKKLVTSCLLLACATRSMAQDPLAPDRLLIPGMVQAENFATNGGNVDMINSTRYEIGEGQSIRVRRNTRCSYPVAVAQAANYDIRIRYALTSANIPRVIVRRNGGPTAVAERVLSRTPSNDFYVTEVIANVPLPAGNQTLDVFFDNAANDFGTGFLVQSIYFELKRTPSGATTGLHVSPAGDDAANGSNEAPYKTVRRAFARVAEINGANPAHGPIDIILLEGYHEISALLPLNSTHTGTARGPITVRPASGEKAIIGGGRRVNPDDLDLVTDGGSVGRLHAAANGKVFRARLTGDDWKNRFASGMVSWNGNFQRLAQFPNKSIIETRELTTGTVRSFKLIQAFDDAKWRAEVARGNPVTVTGHLDGGPEFFASERLTAVGADERLTIEGAGGFGSGYTPRVRVVNLLAELDQPGEWYYDPQAEQFYIWPITPVTGEPEIRVGSNYDLINSKGGANFITFQNLIFQDIGGGAFNGIGMEGCDYVQFIGNTFRNSVARATLRLTGISCKCNSNDWYHVQNTFIIRGGAPNAFPFTEGNTEAINNLITETFGHGYSGFCAASGVGSRVSNNLIHEIHGGGNFNEVVGCLIENNEMYNSGFENGDWTPYYSDTIRTCTGTVLRSNFTHHQIQLGGTRRMGVMRAEQPGVHFLGNVFYKTGEYGIAFGHPGQLCSNNIAVDTAAMQIGGIPGTATAEPVLTPAQIAAELQWERTTGLTTAKAGRLARAEQRWGTDFWKTPYFRYYSPHQAATYNLNPFYADFTEYRGNILAGVDRTTVDFGLPGTQAGQSLAAVGLADTIQANAIYQVNQFRDVNTLNFNFAGGVGPQGGFWRIPFDNIGLFVDGQRRSVPHKPTYRAGAKLRWAAYESTPRGAGFRPTNASDVYKPNIQFTRYAYDCGTVTSPLQFDFQLVTAETVGSYGWTNTGALAGFDRNNGANSLNRDVVIGPATRVFEQAVENGVWYAQVTFGDSVARDNMSLRAESQPVDADNGNVDTAAGQYVNRDVAARVVDGRLSLEIKDNGGDPSWAVTRIIIQNIPFSGQAPLDGQRLGIFTVNKDTNTTLVGNTLGRSNGQYIIQGGGADIFGTADGYHFAHRGVTSSSATVAAQVTALTNTNADAKAGVMYRESLAAGARHVSVFVRPDGQVYMIWRSAADGASSSSGLTSGAAFPKWVRVLKNGDAYTGQWSANGSTWTTIRAITLPIGNTNLAGLAVTSHNQGALARGVFANVSVGTTTAAAALAEATEPWGDWLARYEFPADTALESDTDGDGSNLLMEYALSLDPRLHDQPAIQLTHDGQLVSYTFPAVRSGIAYTVEHSTNLRDWSSEDVSQSNGEATMAHDPAQPARFMRLRLERR